MNDATCSSDQREVVCYFQCRHLVDMAGKETAQHSGAVAVDRDNEKSGPLQVPGYTYHRGSSVSIRVPTEGNQMADMSALRSCKKILRPSNDKAVSSAKLCLQSR